MSAKRCQDFRQRAIAAACDAGLDGMFEILSLAWQNADVGEIVRFASAMIVRNDRTAQVGVHRVAHLGNLLMQADFQRPLPQFVMPARQHRIEGGPFWQVSEFQAFAENFGDT